MGENLGPWTPAQLSVDLWDRILSRTDARACVLFRRCELACELATAAKDKGSALIEEMTDQGILLGVQVCIHEGFRCDNICSRAAAGGHLNIVKWLVAHRQLRYGDYAMDAAAKNGHLEVLQWLHQGKLAGYKICTKSALNWGAEAGHLDVVKWLHHNRKEGCTTYAMNAAAKNGHLEVVQWLHENRKEGCTRNAMDAAASKGHLDILQWLHDNREEGFTQNAFQMAVVNGHLDAVRWLDANWPCDYTRERDSQMMEAWWTAGSNGDARIIDWLLCKRKGRDISAGLFSAAENGHLHVVKRLHACWRYDRVHDCLLGCMNGIAANGHVDVIEWLNKQGSRLSTGISSPTMVKAAERGHLNVVRWLHKNRSEGCLLSAPYLAAENGHLGVVMWLHDHRAEINWIDGPFWRDGPCLMDEMAMQGRLTLLRWWQGNGKQFGPKYEIYVCTTEAMDRAAENGHLDVVQWLHEHRKEGCTTKAMDGAAKKGHLLVVKWLQEHRKEGCTTIAMDGAAENGHVDVVQWLHEHREEGCTTKAMDGAAENGHLLVVKWLHEHRQEGCTTRAMDRAAGGRHWPVVRWLHNNRREGCTTAAMDNAGLQGRLDVLQWLHSRRTEGATSQALLDAVFRGDLDVVRWLKQFQPDVFTAQALAEAVSMVDRLQGEAFRDIKRWLIDNDLARGSIYMSHLRSNSQLSWQNRHWIRDEPPEECLESSAVEELGLSTCHSDLVQLQPLHADQVNHLPPPLTLDQVEAWEQENSVKLPSALRLYVSKISRTVSRPPFLPESLLDRAADRASDCPCHCRSGGRNYHLIGLTTYDREKMERGMQTAHIILDGPLAGSVFLYDADPWSNNTYLRACMTFVEFIRYPSISESDEN